MTWQGNIFYGASLGMTQPQGVTVVNPALVFAADGLWRASPTSAAVDAAVGAFPFVTLDMDGQSRDVKADIGADEVSTSPVIHRPFTRADVGPPAQMLTSAMGEKTFPAALEQDVRLYSNYPNPFNPQTMIRFTVPREGRVELKVVNLLGQEVCTLLDGVVRGREPQIVAFNASRLTSGVYIVQLQYEEQKIAQKMIFAK